MKINSYVFVLVLCIISIKSQSQVSTIVEASNEKNYIKTSVPQTQSGLSGNTLHTVQYFDGLGRADQSIQVGASPNKFDIVQPFDYDDFGREKKKYLPYTLTTGNSGEYVGGELDPAKWAIHGSEKNYAYGETQFDGSPLNRVVAQGAPGSDWQVNGNHKVQIEYGTNYGKKVLLFELKEDKLERNGYYLANQLYKTITKDENYTSGNLHSTEEFKNKLGQVVLKRSWLTESTSVDTYYVYDDYGLLRYVLPPKAVETYLNGGSTAYTSTSGYKVIESNESLSAAETGTDKYFVKQNASLTLKPGYHFKASSTQSLLIKSEQVNMDEFNELIYVYKYDGRKRMIEKKLPGAMPVYMVYDNRDRLVATQDGNQRAQNKWLVTKYDHLNRPVLTALYGSSKNQANLQKEVNDFYAISTNPMFESKGGLKSYNNKSFPTGISDADVLTATYYDDYTFDHCPQSAYNPNQLAVSALEASLLPLPKGQVTGTWVKTLNADSGKPGGLWTVNFYDKKYRVVQTYSDNYLNGYDRTTNQYDFVGKVDRSIHEHVALGKTIVENKWMKYDHAGRLTKVELAYSGVVNKTRTTIAEMLYDELGQLETKKLTKAGRNLDYKYNIRGWLTQMNAHRQSGGSGRGNDEFGFALNYQSGAATFGGEDQFNGNIGSMEWWSKVSGVSNHRQAYGYTYDALNRISKADFKTYTSGWKDDNGYDVTGITYDLNGNIKTLNRYDKGNHIDQLGYGYNGNQLRYVNDARDDNEGFKELSSNSLEYSYDANGNMTRDDNKKISDIDYNLLNLPEFVEKKDANNKVRNLAYAYDAAGVKLENRLPNSKKLQYCTNFVYENGSLKYILNDEGKLNVGDGSNTYQFFVKDHLGNTRLSVRESGEVEELNHYYPFGMRMNMADSKIDADQKYLYNGKELQDETDWLDYGARMYDASLGRFMTVDPLAEDESNISFSPYHYTTNNPIRFIDPTGMIWTDANGKELTEEQRKNVQVYIFYQPGGSDEGGFEEQTMALYEKFIEKYGEGSVALSTGDNNESFVEDWKGMNGDNIQEVWLNYHGDAATVELPNGVMSSAGNKTNESGRDAVDISNLPSPSGDISGAKLQINSCRAADDKMFNDGSPTVAQAFTNRFQQDNSGFAKIRAASGGVSYWPSGKPFSYFTWQTSNKPALKNMLKKTSAIQLMINHGLDPR